MKLIEEYLTVLQDQFNPSIQLATIRSDMNEEWTECYDARCDRIEVSYERKFCKSSCILAAARRAAAQVGGMIGQCNKAKNPESCLRQLRNAAEHFKKKAEKAKEDQRDARAKAAEFRRKAAGGGAL